MWKKQIVIALILSLLFAALPYSTATRGGKKKQTAERTKGSSKGMMMMSAKGKKGKKGRPVETDYFQKAVAALGGADALAALEAVSIASAGSTWMNFEGDTPDDRKAASTYERTHTIAGDQIRIDDLWNTLFENFQFFPPSPLTRTAVGKVGNIVGSGAFVSEGIAASVTVASMKQFGIFFNPQLLLKMALDNPAMIVGTGNPVELAFSPANVLLYVNEMDGTITKLTTMHNHPLVRDSYMTIEFDAWELEGGGVKFPVSLTVSAEKGNVLWEDTRLEVAVNPVLEDDFFALPEDAESSFNEAGYMYGLSTALYTETLFQLGFIIPPNDISAPPAELTPGVFFLFGAANSLIVEHGEGIILIEAPTSASYGHYLVSTAESLFPDKSISHLITSHYHVDHASGCRAVLSSTSANFVVGVGVKSFWESVLVADSTIVELDKALNTDIIEVAEENGSIVLVDENNMVVTVHHTTRGAHADDMLMVTVETNGGMILFQADLYNGGFGFTVVGDGQVALFDAMKEKGIIDADCNPAVPLTIVPAHGLAQSLEESLAELAGLDVDVGCEAMV